MQIPAGYLADRFGARRLFLAGLLGTSVLALSFALLHAYWLLVLNQAISGFFRALLFAPGLLLISARFPPNRRAMAMGLYVAGGSSSNVLLNVLGPLLVGPLGWRPLFIVFALAGLLIAALYWRFGYDGARPARTAPPPLRDLLRLFRYRTTWLAAEAVGGYALDRSASHILPHQAGAVTHRQPHGGMGGGQRDKLSVRPKHLRARGWKHEPQAAQPRPAFGRCCSGPYTGHADRRDNGSSADLI